MHNGLTAVPSESLRSLRSQLAELPNLIVAFSGGVDSGVLLAAAQGVVRGRLLAVTADSASIPRAELDAAKAFAARLGVEHRVVSTGELENEAYARNDTQRCFWCKSTLFETCDAIARDDGFDVIAYGYNADDAHDFRPGHRAAMQHSVRAPLFDAGLGKEAIRQIARELGLDLADKPAAPCLSSRIPYGSAVTTEKLAVIEAMESLLHEEGFAICRARFDGRAMSIEVEADQIERLSSSGAMERIATRARELGVAALSIDSEGFKSGKLNRSAAR